MKVLLDTNTVISGLLWGGLPRRLMSLANTPNTTVRLYTSPILLLELERTLLKPKFAARLIAHGVTASQLVTRYEGICRIVSPASVPRIVRTDPDDDHVIAAALAAQVNLIVSGDRHLLEIARHQDITIVTTAQALTFIAQI